VKAAARSERSGGHHASIHQSTRRSCALGVLLIAAWVSPVEGQIAPLETASWLTGCWIATSASGWTEEVWLEPAGGLMLATARSVREGRATGYEFVVLRDFGNGLLFTAHPSGQDPAEFRSTVVSDTVLRFENPQHDFPRAIEYLRAGPDSIRARVFGEVPSTRPSFTLLYGRRPC
jgi:hypothetical protein